MSDKKLLQLGDIFKFKHEAHFYVVVSISMLEGDPMKIYVKTYRYTPHRDLYDGTIDFDTKEVDNRKELTNDINILGNLIP